MEYKIIYCTTADLETGINILAGEGWELFETPLPHRVPRDPTQWLVIMERGRTPSPDEVANGVTLATIRDWASRIPLEVTEYGNGYARAVKDVRSILSVHGEPPNTPVHFGDHS